MSGFYPYQTAAVRDLAWACFSPALLRTADLHPTRGYVTDAAFELTPARRLWLERLDRDAQPLLEFLADSQSARLGLYFERLWHFFLREDPAVELVAHNLPITDGSRTLGEFDCLYFCSRRATHVHLELAVKFYLGVPGAPAGRAWVGPDVRDRLDLKLAHLLEHQIELGERDAARRQLDALGIAQAAREIALRGYLFQPTTRYLPAPPGYNPERPFAAWCERARLAAEIATLKAEAFHILARSKWLSPRRASPAEQVEPQRLEAAIDAHFAARESPVLVAALNAAAEEYARFFVVPGGWPGGSGPQR